jgi:hypothetical protein
MVLTGRDGRRDRYRRVEKRWPAILPSPAKSREYKVHRCVGYTAGVRTAAPSCPSSGGGSGDGQGAAAAGGSQNSM